MKIKDIVNRDIVNLTNCDQEPIHIPGSIQPHGFMFGLTEDFVVDFCSGNTMSFIEIPYNQILKKSLVELIGEKEFQQFKIYSESLTGAEGAPLTITINEKKFTCSIHHSKGILIAEFELAGENPPAVHSVYSQTIRFVQYMEETATLQQLCDKVASEIKLLTGYDRVMVYRFDKDYNGEVIAEALEDGLEPFLGLHYPHTDIPVQARELYIKNLVRVITDVNYTPVPVFTVDDGSDRNLDMSYSILRSTSPIHVQYLHNMGVSATLTISLLHEGKLWGLIACHHYAPKTIDHYNRVNALLQGHFLTSQINIRQTAEQYTIAKNVNSALENILNKSFPPERNSIGVIISDPALLALCNAGGVVIMLDGDVYKNGKVPTDEQVRKIFDWTLPFSRDRVFNTSKLTEVFPEAIDFCNVSSGIIFYSLRSSRSACIIWFNPETLEEVSWAGDPQKAIEKNHNGLSPRKSFETWKEVIKCQAREWNSPELTAAANYAYALQKHITYILLNEERVQQRVLSDQLRQSHDELENINWISTHDLQEPLRKIQIFSSKLLADKSSLDSVTGITVGKINESAQRMRNLIDGLSIYARTRHTEALFEEIDLSEVLRVLLVELTDEIQEKNGVIHLESLPKITGIPVLIQQLFMNLVNNALKFSKDDTDPVIHIIGNEHSVLHPDQDVNNYYHKIIIKDNGIGFDSKMKETVFKVFSRLHPSQSYEGSGIGLALCKKIMTMHQGIIEAVGKVGEGASFILYFPVKVADV